MKNQSKQKAYFKHVLAIDCETTGLAFGANDPSDGHQAISWGLVVADSQTFKTIEELYLEIQWNPVSIQSRKKDPKFGQYAEGIHGLTQSYLKENGIPEIEAVAQIASLILKYWGPTNAVSTLGHNVGTFDVPFLRAMFQRHDIDIRFANRHMDSFSLGVGTVGAFDSNNLFETMGNEARTDHNALDDCKMALQAFAVIKKLWVNKVGLET